MNTLSTGRDYYTLITGASEGIGKAMAEECAKRGLNLLLVALDQEQLHTTTAELAEKYRIKTASFGVDLTADHAVEKVLNWINTNQYTVDKLINNVGFGRNGLFYKIDESEYFNMIRLNNEVLIQLTYRLLPSMLTLPGARIMNMSSIEANMPNPYKAVYTGTKSFVYAFSLALREELADTPVKVSVLCPGPTITNEDGLKRVKLQGKKAQLLVMFPPEVAKAAVEGMLKGTQVIVPGWKNALINRLMYLLPTKTKMKIMARIFSSYKE